MRNAIRSLGLLTSLVILCGGCATTPPPPDTVVLQGNWVGREMKSEVDGMCTLNIFGSDLEFQGADAREWYKGTFTLREDTEPKQLIGVITACSASNYVGKPVNAIYRLDGKHLTIVGNEPGNPEAPKCFSAPGSRWFVLVPRVDGHGF